MMPIDTHRATFLFTTLQLAPNCFCYCQAGIGRCFPMDVMCTHYELRGLFELQFLIPCFHWTTAGHRVAKYCEDNGVVLEQDGEVHDTDDLAR